MADFEKEDNIENKDGQFEKQNLKRLFSLQSNEQILGAWPTWREAMQSKF